jgi:hypothetical protein
MRDEPRFAENSPGDARWSDPADNAVGVAAARKAGLDSAGGRVANEGPAHETAVPGAARNAERCHAVHRP